MKKTLITLLILGLVGCNDSSDSSVAQPEQKKPVAETPEQLVEALQENGEMPVLDVSKDILANDTDNDGVRDEIQTFIESKEIPAKQKEKALEFAKVTQSAMSIDLSNDVQVNQFANDMGKAIDCLIESSESDEDALKMLQELEAYTVNTEERAKAYKEFNQSLAGGVFSIPDSVDCGE